MIPKNLRQYTFNAKFELLLFCVLHIPPDDGPAWPKHVAGVINLPLFIRDILFTAVRFIQVGLPVLSLKHNERVTIFCFHILKLI